MEKKKKKFTLLQQSMHSHFYSKCIHTHGVQPTLSLNLSEGFYSVALWGISQTQGTEGVSRLAAYYFCWCLYYHGKLSDSENRHLAGFPIHTATSTDTKKLYCCHSTNVQQIIMVVYLQPVLYFFFAIEGHHNENYITRNTDILDSL